MPGSSPGLATHGLAGGHGVSSSVVAGPGVVVRISLAGTGLALVMSVVAARPLEAGPVTSPVLVAGVVLGVAALVSSHHHMTSRPGAGSLPRQVASLALPSVGQRLSLQLQGEAGVLAGPGGTEGGAAGGNNLEAESVTSEGQMGSWGTVLQHWPDILDFRL